MRVLTEIRYTGNAFHGWQAQKNAPSVQKTLQNAAEALLGAPCAVTGCSRTDAGVHALQFFALLDCPEGASIPFDKLPTAINTLLPGEVAVLSACEAPEGFHPRYSALAKEYEYKICCAPQRDPFLSGRVWSLPGKSLDATKMHADAQAFVGTHDFTSFCAAGGKIADKVRTVRYFSVQKRENLIFLRVCADGFLYNMVRILVGTLVDCALGSKEDFQGILAGKDRALAGRTAPPQGLYLRRVFYSEALLAEAIKNGGNDPQQTD